MAEIISARAIIEAWAKKRHTFEQGGITRRLSALAFHRLDRTPVEGNHCERPAFAT
jgi:hypothetical protein